MKSALHRTQIYLPEDLRNEIEKQRGLTNESLAEYLRTAAKERLKREKRRKKDSEKLADEFSAFVKSNQGKSGWEGVYSYKEIRRMRQEEDKHWLKRWVKK